MSRLSQDLPDERYRDLRGAVFESDGKRVMEALAGEVPVAVLQIAGDGLLVALDQHVEGTTELASAVSAALRERSNEGDTELAGQLDAALGAAPTPMLRPLPVDLDDLSSALEGDPMLSGGRLDLRTGDVLEESPMFHSSLEDEDLADPGSWLHIESRGSRPGYGDLVAFLDTIDDDALAQRLGERLHGRGVFRRFKDGLAEIGELERFHRFADDRSRGRARAWLAAYDYCPTRRRRV